MGKATIIGTGARNLERAQYRVRIEKSDDRALAQAKVISREMEVLDGIITTRYSEYSTAQSAYSAAESDLDAIVRQSIEDPINNPDSKVNAATQAEREAYAALLSAKSKYQLSVLKHKSLENKKYYLENKLVEDIRTVWCADCNRNLTGEVATIEIPNTDDTILIRPGGADGTDAGYSQSRDGQLRSVAAMSAAEAAWNYTMFPGWQKWKPLYRLGKITRRIQNNSKCDILLDAYSTVQGLATDVDRTLINVPMVYKNRDDGGPYEVGDRVVVEFVGQDHESPRVIGYEQFPCTTSSSTTTTSISVTTTTTTTLTIMYMQDYTGLILLNNADTGAFISSMGNTPYCPGYPPCVFRGLAASGTKLIQGAIFHRKLLELNIDTGAVENIYTDSYAAVFGSPPPTYPTGRWKGILDLGYDPNTGNVVSVMGDPPYDPQGYVVVHNGISDSIISSNHLILFGSYQYSPHAITVINGDLVIYATRTLAPTGSYMVIMDGLSMTVKSTISWPVAYRYNHITSHNGNLIGTGILADPKKVVLHDGITTTVLGSFYVSYDPVGIAVYDD